MSLKEAIAKKQESPRAVKDVGVSPSGSRFTMDGVYVVDEYGEQYDIPYEILKNLLKDLVFVPDESKMGKRRQVKHFGYGGAT